jgi:hypothetical protein
MVRYGGRGFKGAPRLLGAAALKRASATGADTICYLATPLRPFGEPGSAVFKYGKTAK